jgi:mannose-1-phosphate guanylyltransferase
LPRLIASSTRYKRSGSKDNIVVLPDNKLAVIDGLEGYLIAESDNVLLICKKDEEHTIRKYVNDAQIKLGEEYI